MSTGRSSRPHTPPRGPSPLMEPGQTFETVSDKISALVLAPPTTTGWMAGFAASCALLLLLVGVIVYLVAVGVGIWGVNVPVAWGFAIVNFVWWIGIGHAGTLISASLLLLRQHWRTGISRFAETMTLAAITCASLFPLLHLGRPWFFYWLLPYPNTVAVWPQFRSALVWDVFAVLTYMLVSLLFWYVSLIPDLATLRDRTRSRIAGHIYAILSLGWRGDVRHWGRHRTAYHLLAGLATGLVVSVHSIVAFDFATTVLPGWHTTILPPYFVTGALHSGFAMVLVLIIPLRRIYRLQEFITQRHLQNVGKLLLTTSLILGYCYLVEVFGHWYSHSEVEWYAILMRLSGPYAVAYWATVACSVLAPQVLWLRRARSSRPLLWTLGLVVLIGMWLERYVIVLSSLHRDFLPSSWGPYSATIWDWATFLGTFGLFFAILLVCLRWLPMISMFETRELVSQANERPEENEQDEWPEENEPPEEIEPDPANPRPPVYGMLAEFASSTALVDAIYRAQQAGYQRLEAYSPVPEQDIEEALGYRRSWLPILVFLGGMGGALGGYFLQYYLNAVDYPINVGGRPLNSWPPFTVVTFELTVLVASLTAVLGMLALSGLPRLHHPVFNVPRFSLASRNRFFLCVRADDTRFISEFSARQFLQNLGPLGVWEAPQ